MFVDVERLLRSMLRAERNTTTAFVIASSIVASSPSVAYAEEAITTQAAPPPPPIEAEAPKPPVQLPPVPPEPKLTHVQIGAEWIRVGKNGAGLLAKAGSVLFFDTNTSDMHVLVQAFDANLQNATSQYETDLPKVHDGEPRLLGGRVYEWDAKQGAPPSYVMLQATLSRKRTSTDDDYAASIGLSTLFGVLVPGVGTAIGGGLAGLILVVPKSNEVVGRTDVEYLFVPLKPGDDQQVIVPLKNGKGREIARLKLTLHAQFTAPVRQPQAPAPDQSH